MLTAVLMMTALGLAAPLLAQVADAVLEVTVTDETGQVLPGAAVTVSRPDTGFQRVVTTGENGTARLPALSPGAYRIQLELSGFAQVVQENVVLRVGQTARIDAKMKVAAVQETITVTAEAAPIVDVYKTDSSTNIVPEQIQSLPVADRDFQRLAFLTPGVQRERGGFRFIGGGPVIGANGNASQATILVDGVDFTDPTLGLARARFSQDAIGEFRVIANRFDTEVGNSAGGALSIVTKSGTNELSGSAFGFFRDKSLRSKGYFDQQKNDFSRQQYGFTLGGPIQKDRTHFFASFEQISEDNITLFRPQGAFVNQAADVTHPFDQSLGFLGLDQKISDRQQLKAKLVYERYREKNFRVGGVQDLAYGQQLNRDNWNLTLTHTWTMSSTRLNTLYGQVGKRKYEEPTNSSAVAEWFSSGNTLRTGENIVGPLLGDDTQFELRDTFFVHLASGKTSHDIKAGFAWQHVKDRFDFPVYDSGLLIYLTDTRALPLAYGYAVGSGDATISTNILSGYVQDDFRPLSNLTLNLGLRYDLDTNGNNPSFTWDPLVPKARGKDTNNIQPRFGFSWDVGKDGRNVVRGGVGLFTGRFLLVTAFTEIQQTSRRQFTRVNGAIFGLPQFALNPANPQSTGLLQSPNIGGILDSTFDNPQATQASLGWTTKLGGSGLYFDLEGIFIKGTKEVIARDTNFGGNSNPVRLNRAYNQVAVYTNEGHSKYKAIVASVNGTIKGGHLVTASFTVADKKNINDDFSPEFPFGYPNDPANIEGDYGRARSFERYHVVVSGVFKLPWQLSVAPIYEYGSGQPWTHRLGYDFNGDGYNSDRPAGVARFGEDGPRFSQLSLRLTKRVNFGKRAGLDLIAEGFNLFDTVNYDVNSVQGGEFLNGPTLQNPRLPYVPNAAFGKFTATLPPREIQLGVRVFF